MLAPPGNSSAPMPKVRSDGNALTADEERLAHALISRGLLTREEIQQAIADYRSLGFTVARTVESDEMQRLCAVYEASDEEGRRLIRLFAELSISDALQIPPVA